MVVLACAAGVAIIGSVFLRKIRQRREPGSLIENLWAMVIRK